MNTSSAYLFAASAICFSVYYLVTFWRSKRKAAALGCKPTPVWRSWDLLGLGWSKVMIKAMKECRLSLQFDAFTKEMSAREGREVKTFQLAIPPGLHHFFTTDPRNLQAVLATQFKDFQLPLGRLAAFEKLLGQGIVSALCRDLTYFLTAIVFI